VAVDKSKGMKMKILLMEDDMVLGETIEEMLCGAGYDVTWVKNGEEGAIASYDDKYDLYIFDINVPLMNGFELLESLREAQDETMAIFISALTDMVAMTKGFEVGADDYIKKPFYPQELLLKIDAKFKSKKRTLTHGDIKFNQISKEVKFLDKVISLGAVTLSLLELFINNIGRTILKEELMDLMEHPSEMGLRVAINKLKHITKWEILNIRGVGYRIDKS
jgi:DNA-binding response OmpR family regulator